MTIEEFYRKLKEKDPSYLVMENQWGTAFTVYYKGKDYKDYKLLHVYLSKLVQLYGWNLKLEGLIFRKELINLVIYPLQLIKKLDEPLCTDEMPMLDSGFNGEREIKL